MSSEPTFLADMFARLSKSQPDRHWTANFSNRRLRDDALQLLSTTIGHVRPCRHLVVEPKQQMIVALAGDVALCAACAVRLRTEPPENNDRCDFCLRHGVTYFRPYVYEFGPLVVIGDACDNCDEVLR